MESLGSRLARGEEGAFAELYDATSARLHRYLSIRLGSKDVAEDVLQATFLRAVANRRKFKHVEDPAGYLFRIAVNEAAREGTRRRRAQKKRIVPEVRKPPSQNFDELEIVAAALNRLDARDREIVELKIYGDLTFEEVSAVLNLPQGTVATRYRRALESLRPWLSRQLR